MCFICLILKGSLTAIGTIFNDFPKTSDIKNCYNYPKMFGFTMHLHPKDRMAQCVDPDQTAPDQGLNCLPRHVRLNIKEHCYIPIKALLYKTAML